jgi:hypothetical protein
MFQNIIPNITLGLFPCVQLITISLPHYIVISVYSFLFFFDIQDDANYGLGFIATFGDYTGGKLVIPDYGLIYQILPGDLIFIHSQAIRHWVLPFEGTRHSVVGLTCNNL